MCRASGQDSMRDLLPVFSDNESSAGDRGNGLLEPDACGIWAAAICASTLFTKQHGILDVAAGIALAELSYICVIRWKKTERFRLWMEKKRI